MKIRSLITSIAVVAAGVLGMVAVAPTASAATATTACFKWYTGAPYASQPVHLMKWTGSTWTSIRSGKTNKSGCATFSNTPSNVYLTMKGYTVLGNTNIGLALFEGWAPRYANPGAGGVGLGTGVVGLVQCVPGLYGSCAGFA